MASLTNPSLAVTGVGMANSNLRKSKQQNRLGYFIRKVFGKTEEVIKPHKPNLVPPRTIVVPSLFEARLSERLMDRDVETTKKAREITQVLMAGRYDALQDELDEIVESVIVDKIDLKSTATNRNEVQGKISEKINKAISKVVGGSSSDIGKHLKTRTATRFKNVKQSDGSIASVSDEGNKDQIINNKENSNDTTDSQNDKNDKDSHFEVSDKIAKDWVNDLIRIGTVTTTKKDSVKMHQKRLLNVMAYHLESDIKFNLVRNAALSDPIGDNSAVGTSTTLPSISEEHKECQTDEVSVETDSLETPGMVLGRYFKISSIRHALRDKKWVKFNEKLTYYLRIKYFMRKRDQHLLNQMVNDARNYLIKAGNTVDNQSDYLTLTTSVTAAFLITEEEIECRESVKTMENLDSMRKINELSSGQLGHLPHRGLKEWLSSQTNTFINNRKRTATFDEIPTVSC